MGLYTKSLSKKKKRRRGSNSEKDSEGGEKELRRREGRRGEKRSYLSDFSLLKELLRSQLAKVDGVSNSRSPIFTLPLPVY